jgi:hypothetical protein
MNESKLNQFLLDIDLNISSLELERIELKLSTFKNVITKAYETGQNDAFDEAYQMVQRAIKNKKS